MRAKVGALGTLLLVALALTACGSSSKTTAAPPAPPAAVTTTTIDMSTGDTAMGGMNEGACTPVGDKAMAMTTITVTEREWSITTSTNRTPKGMTHFAVKNEGKEKHELAIYKGGVATLITNANGSIDESSLAEGTLLGRVTVAAGTSCDMTVDLPVGDVTVACNIVDDMGHGEMHVHFAKGMSQSLKVV